jgi:hypothetical protein
MKGGGRRADRTAGRGKCFGQASMREKEVDNLAARD